MATNTLLPSILSYQDILSSAYRNLGTVGANTDLELQQANQQFDTVLTRNKEAEQKAQLRTREANSGRGLLHSTAALNDQADVTKGYADQNASALTNLNTIRSQLARKRLEAQNQYTDAQTAFERYRAASIPMPQLPTG